jgi:hypothetical protein
MDIIAITVSVNYDDILKHVIGQNAPFFKEWVIITSPEDEGTKAVINDAKLPNITTLYFDRFKHNAAFNKGGAIRFAQQYVYNKYKKAASNTSILILDSDIAIPNNFNDLISGFIPENDAIYGVRERFDYNTLEDFLKQRKGELYIFGHKIVGFFQLYKLNTKYKYDDSNDCGRVDNIFRDKFPHQKRLEISLSHLGRNSINWYGRDKKADDIFSKCRSHNCNYMMNTDISKNMGPYCCGMCKRGELDHGPWCQKKT